MVVAAAVAAFILGLLCAAVLLKRFARHFPADQDIGKAVLHMTRHAGFKDFVAVAFIAGIFLCALIGGALWYYFPRVEVVTQQVPVDRVVPKEVPVTKEVVRETPAPAPNKPPPTTQASQTCPGESIWDEHSRACIPCAPGLRVIHFQSGARCVSDAQNDHFCPPGYSYRNGPNPGCYEQ